MHSLELEAASDMMAQSTCCEKMSVKRGVWSPEEDAKMMAYVSKYGTGNWTAAPKKAGLRRCGKSCRLRWNNYLRPDLKHDNFTPQEEELIIKLHGAIGTRWSIIAQQLPGRTDNDVKNYWNSKLRKKLQDMGIDPVTHKPYSQILADYGNIGGLRKFGHSLNKDLKNAFTQIEGNPEEQFVHFSSGGRAMPKDGQVRGARSHQNVHEATDLLDQLQAIKKFTEATSSSKNIETAVTASPQWGYGYPTLSPTSSSSSSACSAGNTSSSLQGLNWQDYLLDDLFIPSEDNMAEYFMCSTTDGNQKIEGPEPAQALSQSKNITMDNHGSGATVIRASDASFLDDMLAKESEMMLLEFPSLLEDSTFES